MSRSNEERDRVNRALPHPEVVRVAYEATNMKARVAIDPNGVAWAQIFCEHHNEWETHPDPFPSEATGVNELKVVDEIEGLIKSLKPQDASFPALPPNATIH
jgi:hypothetical protein